MTEFGGAIFEDWFGSGGEMAALIRSHLNCVPNQADDSQPPLESVGTWSQSLKTALSILLNTGCPMFLVWGADRTLFYNDAFFSFLKKNHTSIPLGRSINRWPEEWQSVQSDVEQVFATGQPSNHGYELFSLAQDNHSSDRCYTWFYSALRDETGQVRGVFVTGCIAPDGTGIESTDSTATAQGVKPVSIDRYPIQEMVDPQIPELQTLQQAKAALRQSEARFQAFMNHSPTAAWIVDPAGHILYLSPTYFRMFWTPQPMVIGKSIQELYEEKFAQQFLENNRQVFETGQVIEVIETAPRPDGSIGSFLVCKFPIVQESEAVVLGGVAIDITERQSTEQTLWRREEELRLITNALPVPIAYVDKDQHYRFNNQAYETWFGEPASTLMGKHVRDVLGETAYQTVYPYIEQVLSGQQVNFESQVSYRKGISRYINAQYVPHINCQGEVEGFFSLVNDISDRKQVEEALRVSEGRLRSFVESNIIGIVFCNIHGDIHEANDELLRIVGYTREDLQAGRLRWIDITPPEYLPIDQQAIAEARKATGVCVPYEKEYIRKDGVRIPVLVGFSLVGKTAEEAVAFILDLSERKQAEVALCESEDRLRIAIESAQLGTWDWNLRTNELTWDAGCKDMFSLPPDAEVNIKVFFEGLHPDDRQRLEQIIQWAFNPVSGGTYDAEYRAIGLQDKIERWIRAKGQAYFDQEGHPQRFVGTVLDITEQKRVEVEREQLLMREQAAREAAEKANRIKDEFLAVLSHELRSPLNPILGWAKLLQTGRLDAAKTQQALVTIERNARLQAELIEDLLDVSRILQGKLSLAVSSVNLVSTVQAAIETVRLAAEAKSIDLRFIVCDPGIADNPQNPKSKIQNPNFLVSGDSTRLQQVVWNLLSNGLKFTPTGGRVEVRLEQVDQQVQITVSDTGKGISPDFLPYVFDYFRQEDGAITRKFGGLGLGLAIVRHLVELHGGTIRVDSPGEGLGATFTVRLPLLNKQASKDGNRADSDSPFLSSALPLTDLRILVVEDDPDTRELIVFLLEQAGAMVSAASSANGAFVALTKSRFNILISDIGMPDMDGYALMRQVRSLPPDQGGQIPAIALTAYAGEIDYQQAMAVGFHRHLAKPVEPEALVAAIIQLLEQNHFP